MTSTDSYDAIVVGAGLSGLTAADDLRRTGADVCVVEARDRIGGRILTRRSRSGAPVEMGAAFVGPRQYEIQVLARRHGLALKPTWDDGVHLGQFGGAVRTWRGGLPFIGPLNSASALAGIALMNRLSRQITPERPWSSKRAGSLDALSVEEWLAGLPLPHESRALLTTSLRSIFAADLAEISLLHALTCIRSADGFRNYMRASGKQQLRFADGASSLCDALAEPLRSSIRLSEPVRAITSGSSVTVWTDRGEIVAPRVIVAIPPRHVGQIDYTPVLSDTRQRVLHDFTDGQVLKYHLLYREPFWRTRNLSGKSMSHDGLVTMTFDHSTEDEGTLVAFVVGAHARRLLHLPQQERVSAVTHALVDRFGDEVRSPVESLVHEWNEDPWSSGCFAGFLPPGSWTSHPTEPAAPHGRIHFAGTETATRYFGAMEGAVTAGQRAAREVLAAQRMGAGA
ncbi:flavin monoamine oxidase family protein [Nocardiopsis tropica]|uniref:flavin monoamine oxidase family protein n=1 Tax=Tsukamurella TaxID=2060 RepID=UPI001C7D39F5|nr:FAD-dependent oxidoreductase [Tsukamurella sp. TY48]GIZ97891.1 putative flavin-containing monoamine oxidase AofH [Tsukamurella sp. TY48]